MVTIKPYLSLTLFDTLNGFAKLVRVNQMNPGHEPHDGPRDIYVGWCNENTR